MKKVVKKAMKNCIDRFLHSKTFGSLPDETREEIIDILLRTLLRSIAKYTGFPLSQVRNLTWEDLCKIVELADEPTPFNEWCIKWIVANA